MSFVSKSTEKLMDFADLPTPPPYSEGNFKGNNATEPTEQELENHRKRVEQACRAAGFI
jgi:hypothetical protein